jgi:glycosyltransferase involved in cell wall biosynthesis
VDLIVAASPVLKERCHGRHRNLELLAHGVDLHLFRKPLPPVPAWLERIPEPRVGFYGLLDERLDQHLVAGIAGAMKGVNFVLAGPQVTGMPGLQALPNVHFPGSIPYEQLPAFVHGLQALIMPYRVDAFTNTLAPLKLKEYLLSGLPVVVSPLAGTAAVKDCLLVASTEERWVHYLGTIVDGRMEPRSEQAGQSLAGDGWDARSAMMLRLALGRETTHA